ncbi:peptidoglycan DD-metalloendopeptidase family protein [Vibrio hepatarius]|uniref:peptidoglycan DD-metalloendopeptidase family protein n=1 Tax=Vibrio hepatarius TaxID=171383 RepID=UPI001C08B664|nr:peptidoglycan DD-metalloendopeptidase family protein [Vibrio hepatarius]MBU2896399.1 peptidoglycan DD-metalloendopeptidase family protein [Vibrio hepatarius]
MIRKPNPIIFFVSVVSAMLFGCSAHFPAPVSGLNKDYSSIARGSYRGSYYQVDEGDTLYFIAYVTDRDVNDIIRYNDLRKPYTIFPGQKLKLWQPAYKPPAYGGAGVSAVSAPIVTASTSLSSSKPSKSSNQIVSSKKVQNKPTVSSKAAVNEVDQYNSKEYVGAKSKINVNKPVSYANPNSEKVSRWLWPAKGRVITNFSAGDQGNKGIDIAGQRGQPISSTANGTVVYSGNALRGYGNLVIIKHNDNYLSAYAHNERLLVHEGQSVKAGQKIATMGSSGANSVRLHFEIRYQGKSVNPKRYLP